MNTSFQSVAWRHTCNVIAAFLPLRRRLAGKLERSGPVADGVRFPAIFSSHEGPLRLICNFCRPFGSGKPSFLPLVQACKQASGSVFHGFQVSPGGFPFDAHLTPSAATSGLVALSDGHRGSKREIANVRTSSGEIRNVVR